MLKEKQFSEIAKKHGFDKATFEGKWNGYDVYLFSMNRLIATGYPVVLLSYGDEYRMASYEEVKESMIYFNKANGRGMER